MSARKAVTLKAVAERVGASVQTVATVLNGSKSNTVVSAETRVRILAVAEEMRYRRNALARSLRRGYTNIIGFYTGYGTISQKNPFVAEVFGGIQASCNQHHKDLLIHGTFRGDSVDDIYDELTSGKIDGLVIFSPTNDRLVKRLQAAPLPVVALAEAVQGIRSVVMNDIEAGRQAVQHLTERGHRHILYRNYPNSMISALRRLEGIQSEATRLNIRITPISTMTEPLFGVGEEERILLTATIGDDRPTAVICWCDAAANVLLEFLADNQIAVPERIAVVGFDGFDLPFPSGLRLTTLVAPWAEAGHRAVSLLVGGESEETEGCEVQFEMTLRPGNTT